MFTHFTREQLANMSANRNISRLNGLNVVVGLQGRNYSGVLVASDNGTAIVRFNEPRIYFGTDSFEITSHLNNNYTAHALDFLKVKFD